MGRTKSRPRPLKKQRKFLGLPTPKQRLEKCNIYKLCISKLARIDDPQAKLCKAVLINNTLKKLENQPEYLYNETETQQLQCQEKILDENINQPTFETICSHLVKNGNIHSNFSHEYRTVPLPDGEIHELDTLSMCDDIINEFLGVPEVCEADCKSSSYSDNINTTENLTEQNKENFDHPQQEGRERVHEIGGKSVSPYSYSSFLSEVYSHTLRKIKYKVEL